ncbi:MAG: hypothetical protein ACPL28_11105, partial [bacterium]
MQIQQDYIDIGPVRFWKASKYSNFIPSELQDDFDDYCKINITNNLCHRDNGKTNCVSITLENITCVSLNDMDLYFLKREQKNNLIFDAVNIICFVSNLPKFLGARGSVINDLSCFLNIHKLDIKKLRDRANWQRLWWWRYDDATAQLDQLDERLLACFGEILQNKFCSDYSRWAKRIIRAIEYFNLITKGELYEGGLFARIVYAAKPEDVVFLSTAFESLLDVHFGSPDRKETQQKIGNALISYLQLDDYEAPQEILRQWIKDFYNLRSRIVHGDDIPEQIFDKNPNA